MEPANRHWILTASPPGAEFNAENVFRMVSRDRSVRGDTLLMFTNVEMVDGWLRHLASCGILLATCTLETADRVTDLLSELKKAGTTHVCIDPDNIDPYASCRPIDSVIIDFQLSE